MKTKKSIMFILISLLSLALMGCPTIANRKPQFVQIVDGEPTDINSVTYEHVKGSDFSLDAMIDDLVTNQNIKAIDYNQTKVIFGTEREYEDITDQVIITTFYEVWEEGSDANRDGVVDALDEDLYFTLKTDENGDYILDQAKLLLVRALPVGQKINFTMRVTDSEGSEAEVSGEIVIVAE
jgi:hypothetical protein